METPSERSDENTETNMEPPPYQQERSKIKRKKIRIPNPRATIQLRRRSKVMDYSAVSPFDKQMSHTIYTKLFLRRSTKNPSQYEWATKEHPYPLGSIKVKPVKPDTPVPVAKSTPSPDLKSDSEESYLNVCLQLEMSNFIQQLERKMKVIEENLVEAITGAIHKNVIDGVGGTDVNDANDDHHHHNDDVGGGGGDDTDVTDAAATATTAVVDDHDHDHVHDHDDHVDHDDHEDESDGGGGANDNGETSVANNVQNEVATYEKADDVSRLKTQILGNNSDFEDDLCHFVKVNSVNLNLTDNLRFLLNFAIDKRRDDYVKKILEVIGKAYKMRVSEIHNIIFLQESPNCNPLHKSILNGNLSVYRMITDKIDKQLTSRILKTPVPVEKDEQEQECIFHAVKMLNEELFKKLCDDGADLTRKKSEGDETIIHKIIIEQYKDKDGSTENHKKRMGMLKYILENAVRNQVSGEKEYTEDPEKVILQELFEKTYDLNRASKAKESRYVRIVNWLEARSDCLKGKLRRSLEDDNEQVNKQNGRKNSPVRMIEFAAEYGTASMLEIILNSCVFYTGDEYHLTFTTATQKCQNQETRRQKTEPLPSTSADENALKEIPGSDVSRDESYQNPAKHTYHCNESDTASDKEEQTYQIIKIIMQRQPTIAAEMLELEPFKSEMKQKWKDVKILHVVLSVIYIVMIIALTIVVAHRKTPIRTCAELYHNHEDKVRGGFEILILTMTGIFWNLIVLSDWQDYNDGFNTPDSLRGVEIVFKVLRYLTCIAIFTAAGFRFACSDYEDVPLALALFFGWMYTLRSVLVFRHFAMFAEMIYRIIRHDMGRFLVVYIITLTALSSAFFCIFQGTSTQDGSTENFRHFWLSAFTLFRMGLGLSDEVDVVTRSRIPGMGVVMFCVSVILVTLILFNILIAMMNETYVKIKKDVEKTWPLFRVHSTLALVSLKESWDLAIRAVRKG